MANLADAIERYICQRLAERETLEVQRRQLALLFGCAPSQINYVLETRFSQERGYVIESRRGGGGFIRITRLPDGSLDRILGLGELLSGAEMSTVLRRLALNGFLNRVEAHMLEQALGEIRPGQDPNAIRARMLRVFLALLDARGR